MARSVTKRLDTFSIINYVVMGLVCLITVYPFWDVLVVSLSSFKDFGATTIHLWPRNWDLSSYQFLLAMPRLWIAYKNTFFITVVGTILSVIFTTMTSYALSKSVKGMRILMFLFVFTMLFDASGDLVHRRVGGFLGVTSFAGGLGERNLLHLPIAWKFHQVSVPFHPAVSDQDGERGLVRVQPQFGLLGRQDSR